jgi:hypothetical protein
MNNLLKFGRGNAKVGPDVFTFSLPAGYTCPGAKHCLAFANRQTGQLTDGPEQEFRCFSASSEVRFPHTRAARWHNYDLLRAASSTAAMSRLIERSLVGGAELVRIHVSGDFFSSEYLLAWCRVADARPLTRFYAYTKSVHLWRRHIDEVPHNLVLTASLGGKFDDDVADLKTAQVVFSEEEAGVLGLAVDHDDSHAYGGVENFALLLHGVQRAGSQAAVALRRLHVGGFTGYARKAA